MKASAYAGRIYNVVVFADEHRENAYECGGLEKMIKTYYASDLEDFEIEIVKYFYQNGSLLSHECIEEIIEASAQLIEDAHRDGGTRIRNINNSINFSYCELVFKVAGFRYSGVSNHKAGLEHKYINGDLSITAIEDTNSHLVDAIIK